MNLHTLGELRASGYRVRSRQGRDARESAGADRPRRDDLSRHPRLRADGHPGHPQRHPLQARHHPPRPARAGQDAHPPLADRAARRARSRSSPAARSTTRRSQPTCKRCRRLAAEQGDDLPIAWLAREERYREKLATPDVTVADLIGDIDPIKAANQRLTYADEEVIHYGIIPRTNRGIFAINELPDLAPRIQVALLNILEERDLQIRGFPVRIPMDVVLVFSANPEDYTSRGNIITPLKDRIDSQILTHYPQNVETAHADHAAGGVARPRQRRSAIEIPAVHPRAGRADRLRGARARSSSISRRGVSARLTIAAMELLQSNLERRAALTRRRVRLSAPLRPGHAPAGDHRQGGDGLRGRAAGRGGRGAQADRRGGGEAVRDEVPADRARRRRARATSASAAATARSMTTSSTTSSPAAADEASSSRRSAGAEAAVAERAELRRDPRLVRRRATRSRSPTSSRSPTTSRELKRVPRLADTARKYVQPQRRRRAGVLDGDGPRGPAPVAAPGARRPRLDDHVPGDDEVQRAADGESEVQSWPASRHPSPTRHRRHESHRRDPDELSRQIDRIIRDGWFPDQEAVVREALASVRRRQVVPRRFAAHAAPLRRRRAQRLEARGRAEVRQPRACRCCRRRR